MIQGWIPVSLTMLFRFIFQTFDNDGLLIDNLHSLISRNVSSVKTDSCSLTLIIG